MNIAMGGMQQVRQPLPKTPTAASSAKTQENNSAEERAIAASTKLNKEISRGDKKSTSRDEAAAQRRKELLKKSLEMGQMNLAKDKVDDTASQIKAMISSGQNLTKQLLDSSGGESVYLYAGLSDLKEDVDPQSELGKKVDEYLDMMAVYKGKTLVSWANTSTSVSETTGNKDHAFGIQSMLSEASQEGMSVRGMFSRIAGIGGDEDYSDIQDSAIKALAADINSKPSSDSSETLIKSLGALSNFQALTSVFKIAEEHVGKLKLNREESSLSSADFVKISLDLSDNFDRSSLTAYSIVSLGTGSNSEYRFTESMLSAVSDYPKSLWDDDQERIDVTSALRQAMSDGNDSMAFNSDKVMRNKFFN